MAGKVHEDPDSKLIALLIKEYLEHYKMDYTLSVYLPEVAMQGAQNNVTREELAEKAGIAKPPKSADQPPLLVQMLQQLRNGGGNAAPGGSPAKAQPAAANTSSQA